METFEDYGIRLPHGSTGNTLILCPECSHGRKKSNDKCLSVHVEKGTWLCHHPHCNWKGNLKGNGGAGIPQISKSKPVPVKSPEKKSLSAEALALLQERYISKEAITLSGVWSEGKTIKFPYFYNKKLVNIKSRRIDAKKFFMEKGGERILYGMDAALDSDSTTLIWVEGELDVLSLYTAGITNVISVPDGAPSPGSKNYSTKFDFLDGCSEFIHTFSQHILAGDSDEAGKKLSDELIRRIGQDKCQRVIWPEDCKDANDTLISHGEEAIVNAINTAIDLPLQGIVTVSQLRSKVNQLYHSGNPTGVSTGWASVDGLFSVLKGCLTTITGIPSHGKSEWLDSLMINVAEKNKWRFLICSPESYPIEQHVARLSAKYIGKPFDSILNKEWRMTEAEAEVSMAWLDNYFTFISPAKTEELNIEYVLKLAETYSSRQRINGLVIDPWGDMIQQRSNGMNETQYVSESLLKIRQFSRKFDVHTFIVAHPKMLTRNQDGSFPVPTPYDISGSAHFRNKSDAIICVWRDDSPDAEDRTTYIYVQKVKNRRIGRTGTGKLDYDLDTGRYTSRAE